MEFHFRLENTDASVQLFDGVSQEGPQPSLLKGMDRSACAEVYQYVLDTKGDSSELV